MNSMLQSYIHLLKHNTCNKWFSATPEISQGAQQFAKLQVAFEIRHFYDCITDFTGIRQKTY
jgi:hypothetical protein